MTKPVKDKGATEPRPEISYRLVWYNKEKKCVFWDKLIGRDAAIDAAKHYIGQGYTNSVEIYEMRQATIVGGTIDPIEF